MEFRNNQPVRILPGANLPTAIATGYIVGKICNLYLVGWIYLVDVLHETSEQYPFQVVGVPEIFLEPMN